MSTLRYAGSGNLQAWQVTLDRLELDVLRLERHFQQGRDVRTDLWDAPFSLGPVPEELRSRAEDLHTRQQRCLERLAATLGATLRQQDFADAVLRATPHGSPLYVDVAV